MVNKKVNDGYRKSSHLKTPRELQSQNVGIQGRDKSCSSISQAPGILKQTWKSWKPMGINFIATDQSIGWERLIILCPSPKLSWFMTNWTKWTIVYLWYRVMKSWAIHLSIYSLFFVYIMDMFIIFQLPGTSFFWCYHTDPNAWLHQRWLAIAWQKDNDTIWLWLP